MEEKILELLKKSPEKGLERLMDKYAGLVYTIVQNKLYLKGSKEDVEECVSGIFYEVYENRNNIDLSKGSLKSFLAVIAKRRAIDVYRKKEKLMGKVVSLEAYSSDKLMDETLLNTTEAVDDRESKELIIDSIKSLGEPDNEIFIRKYYFGQSTKIIAKLLGLKENTVDKKVSRGLVKLRGILESDTIIREREDI